jgi:hypothetical protein
MDRPSLPLDYSPGFELNLLQRQPRAKITGSSLLPSPLPHFTLLLLFSCIFVTVVSVPLFPLPFDES